MDRENKIKRIIYIGIFISIFVYIFKKDFIREIILSPNVLSNENHISEDIDTSSIQLITPNIITYNINNIDDIAKLHNINIEDIKEVKVIKFKDFDELDLNTFIKENSIKKVISLDNIKNYNELWEKEEVDIFASKNMTDKSIAKFMNINLDMNKSYSKELKTYLKQENSITDQNIIEYTETINLNPKEGIAIYIYPISKITIFDMSTKNSILNTRLDILNCYIKEIQGYYMIYQII